MLASVDELWKHMLVGAVTELDSEIGSIVEQGLAQIDSKEKGYEFVRYAIKGFDFENKYTLVDKTFSEDIFVNLFRDMEKRLKEIILDHYRVCSFSSDELVKRMWSHYANGHRGFCIGYDVSHLDYEVLNRIFPVRYKENPVKIHKKFLLTKHELLQLQLINAITAKSVDWEYEKEWRYLIEKPDKYTSEWINLPTPKELIIGAKISDAHKKELSDYAKSKGIECYVIEKELKGFGLQKVVINNNNT